MNRSIEPRDVERIARDVLAAVGDFSILAVEWTGDAWRLTLRDVAGRVIATDIAAGKPAAIRTALTKWLDSQA